MNDLINQLLSDNLSILKGLQLTGRVPVPQDLLNDALGEVLKSSAASAPGSAAAPAASPTPRFDPKALAPFVKRLNVVFKEGVAVLEFDVRVD